MFLGKNFFIAEVGANHQGDSDLALKYVSTFAGSGASAIKFQTRDNEFLFHRNALAQIYENVNSFGKTYGEHRKNLELDIGFLSELKREATTHQTLFASTAFDENSLERLSRVGVDLLKVASFDCGNLPFLKRVAELNVPVVLSTGGCNIRQITDSVSILSHLGKDRFSVLHCVSKYPADFGELDFFKIKDLISECGNVATVGFSCHFNGILSGPIARMYGATVFEKHVTFNRGWAGSDHRFALLPHTFQRFVRDVNRTTETLNISKSSNNDLGSEPVFRKLGKQFVAYKTIREGDIIDFSNVRGQILGDFDGIAVRDFSVISGRRCLVNLKVGTPLQLHMLEGL